MSCHRCEVNEKLLIDSIIKILYPIYILCYFLFRWSYSCLCLETILEIAKSIDLDSVNCNNSGNLNDPNVPQLSVQHEIDIAKCFQLIVGFGLLPNLLPNIGVPIQKRSKFFNLFHHPIDISDEQVFLKIILTFSFHLTFFFFL